MRASTNTSYVGRFAAPGSPKATSTPSALRHSISASTARTSPNRSFRSSKGQCTSGFFGVLGHAEANADRQADDPTDRDEEQRGAHRDPEEAIPDPRDREQLDRHDDPGDNQRLVDVGDEEGQGVEDAPEHRHPAGDGPAHDR